MTCMLIVLVTIALLLVIVMIVTSATKAATSYTSAPKWREAPVRKLYPNCSTPDWVVKVDDPWPPKRLALRLTLALNEVVSARLCDNGDVVVDIDHGVYEGEYLISRTENLDAIEPEDLVRYRLV